MTRAVALGLGLCLLLGARGCTIQGTDSGECMVFDDYEQELSFCSNPSDPKVTYTACMPKVNSLFPSHSIASKDKWVETTYNDVIAARERIEADGALAATGLNENGVPGVTRERFTENDDCKNAYKNFLCFLNFPRCDDEQRSLILCRSVCENYFRACRYDEEMWRCYEPSFYGGRFPEVSETVDADGLPVFWRAQMPGQPFRDNQFAQDGTELPVCTPAILNSASSGRVGALALLAGLLLAVAVALLKH